MKSVFKIWDRQILKTALDAAKNLGYKVDEDNYNRPQGCAISLHTSKKYDVAGNPNVEFYEQKYNLRAVRLDAETLSLFISILLSEPTRFNGTTPQPSTPRPDIVESPDLIANIAEEDADGLYHETVNLFYAKVLKKEKNPSNYWVIEAGYGWTLTNQEPVDNDGNDSGYKNLEEEFLELNKIN